MIFLSIAIVVIIFTAFCLFKNLAHLNSACLRLKSDAIAAFPAIVSNIEDVIFSSRDKISLYKQPSRVAVLTGGNRGIGLHVLKKLLICEMTVVLGVRNPEASRKSVESFIDETLTKGKVFFEKCDTGDLESVSNFAKNVQQKFSAIHLLINNAGILLVPYEKTKDGFESQMAVNYIGHFLLTHLLMPQIIEGSKNNEGKNARVVSVSSCAHKSGTINYDDFSCEKYYHEGLAYADSKLAQIMAAKYIEKISKDKGWKVQSHSAHPGVVDTEIFKNSIWGSLNLLRRLLFKTPERGSRTIVYAAISPDIEGLGGSYLSNCREKRTNAKANDEEACKQLFNFTCRLLNIEEFGKF